MATARKSMDERLRESASRGRLRVVGERRPDETGMLPMAPLGEGREAPPEDVGATAFFRVPAHPERARPMIVPAPPAPPAARAPEAPPAPARPVIHGPVAGRDLVAPAEDSAAARPAPSAEPRIQSLRVLAVLSGVFLLVSVLVLTTALVLLATHDRPAPEAPKPEVPRMVVPVALEEFAADAGDTAAPAAEQEEAPRTPRTPRTPQVEHKRDTPKIEAPKSVTVRFSGEAVPARVEVACQGAERIRMTLVDGAATVDGVPHGVECTLFPKGGVVATSVPVKAGGSYDCRVEGTTTTCR